VEKLGQLFDRALFRGLLGCGFGGAGLNAAAMASLLASLPMCE